MTKITLTERKSLGLRYNLADAQNYLKLSDDQQNIVNGLPKLFRLASTADYNDVRLRFLRSLFDSLSQPRALCDRNRKLLCYSATIGLEVAFNYLRLQGKKDARVAILHPTFDSISYIAKRHELNIIPVSDEDVQNTEAVLANCQFSALILTVPNNPTGNTLSKQKFAEVVNICAAKGATLVLDCCYKYYLKERFDYYEILLNADIDYLLVEDTGKLFPLVDLKVGVLCCNERIFDHVQSIHLDFLLEVSKFSLLVLSEFLRVDQDGSRKRHFEVIERNRAELLDTLGRFGLKGVGGENINVQFLSLPSAIDSTVLQNQLMDKGVGIVDGKRLFWSSHPRHGSNVRIALSRDRDYFGSALKIVKDQIERGFAKEDEKR